MPTKKRKTLVQKIKENLSSENPKSLGQLIRESGYSKNVSRYPAKIIKSNSFQIMLRKSGLNEQIITDTYKEAINQKPKGKITWEVKRKYLEDLANYLGLSPQKEDLQKARIGTYIERFLMVKGSDPAEVKKIKGKIVKEIEEGEEVEIKEED